MSAAQVHFICHPEHESIEGNAIASGDPDIDKQVEEDIREQLEGGNEWAWCVVEAYASIELDGGVIRGESDYLGCCSYASREAFLADIYAEDMRRTALDNLTKAVASVRALSHDTR